MFHSNYHFKSVNPDHNFKKILDADLLRLNADPQSMTENLVVNRSDQLLFNPTIFSCFLFTFRPQPPWCLLTEEMSNQ